MMMIWSVGVNNESRQWRQEDWGIGIDLQSLASHQSSSSCQTTVSRRQRLTPLHLSSAVRFLIHQKEKAPRVGLLCLTLLSSAQGVPLSTHRFFCASFNFPSFYIPCHVTKLKDILRVSVHTQTTVWKISTYRQMGRVKIQIQIEEKRAKLPGMMVMIMKTVLTKKTQLIWPLLLTTMIKGRKLAAFRPSC